jgi:MoaA/NifB/PqqE/SkfB family radical SAM enzyme
MLTLDELRPVFGELREMEAVRVHFTGGEPLIHPELLEILSHCRGLGIPELAMTTNATLVNEQAAERLFAAGLSHVNVSLDGEAEDFHGKLSLALKGLRCLIDARRSFARRERPAVRVNVVIGSNNLTQLPDFVRRLKEAGVDGLNLLPIKRESHLFLNADQIGWFREHAAPVIKECFGEKALERDPYEDSGALEGEYTRDYYQSNRCYIPYVHTFISAGGDVFICCERQAPPQPLGNIHEDSLRAILTGPRYRSERRRLDHVGCRICGMFLTLNKTIDALGGEGVGVE